MRISDWSSDVCSSNLVVALLGRSIRLLHRMRDRVLRRLRPHDVLPPITRRTRLDRSVQVSSGGGLVVSATMSHAEVAEGVRAAIAAYTHALDDGRTEIGREACRERVSQNV